MAEINISYKRRVPKIRITKFIEYNMSSMPPRDYNTQCYKDDVVKCSIFNGIIIGSAQLREKQIENQYKIYKTNFTGFLITIRIE